MIFVNGSLISLDNPLGEMTEQLMTICIIQGESKKSDAFVIQICRELLVVEI